MSETPAATKPPTEVRPRAVRRSFTADYKLKILAEVDSIKDKDSGEIGRVLRREGLYFSHLRTWRKDIAAIEGRRVALSKRAKAVDERDQELADLRNQNLNLTVRLERAELLLSIQKKVCSLLGVSFPTPTEKP